MSVLNVKTQDQILFIEKPVPIITSGNQRNDVIKVTFDETWDCETGKFYASFYIEKPEYARICDLVLEEDRCFRCVVPDEMLRKEGYFHFGVWCDSQDKRKTSDIKMIRVNQGAVTDDDTEESEIDIAVNSAREEYRAELETSLETATGENLDGKTWNELKEVVGGMFTSIKPEYWYERIDENWIA